ncbi:hypothetical protein M3Y94_00171100 [Aphelenchoides besseyi]|nr:hypothetical protein M3Y94_00171100 [Aphelenchoides besseyi]KAI6236978.1 hypothetical protein M3Y95_00216400 [Aphelenchoides besseyi]
MDVTDAHSLGLDSPTFKHIGEMWVTYTSGRPNVTFESDSTSPKGFKMVLVGIELPDPSIKFLSGLLYFGLSISGITLNILWAIILYLGHRHFSQRPFYIVARHLLISDLLCAISQFVVAAPLAVMSYKTALAFRRSTWFNYFSTFLTVGRFSTMIFVFLQILTQIVPFVPNGSKLVYHLSANGSLLCMLGWIQCIGLMCWFLTSMCRNDYNINFFHFFYDCSADPDTAQNMWTWIAIFTVIVLVCGIFVYGIGFRTIERSLKMAKTFSSMEATEKKEFSELKRMKLILCQGVLIVLMEGIRVLCFALVPGISIELPLNFRSFINVLANCAEILSTTMHPLIYIMFNERAQKYLKKIVMIILRQREVGENHTGISADVNSAIAANDN